MSGRPERAARLLLAARKVGERFSGFPPELAPRDEAEGYAVQEALFTLLDVPRAGHKIGCTTSVMQAYLGIDHPCGGVVLARDVHRSPAVVRSDGRRLGVECELAVRLGPDLRPAAAMAAIEIVEDRYADYRALDAPTLIADNFFGTACVLGAEVEPAAAGDLAAARASMWIDGVEAGRGEGSHILGDPLAALAWLQSARPVVPGEIVLLGSVVETCWVEPGSEVVVRNEPLGEVRVRVER